MSLVDKNLLRAERHSMLETIREYAFELLAESGETEEVRRRHAQYFLARAERLSGVIVDTFQSPRLPSPTSWESLRDEAEAELDNFRSALGWCIENALTEWSLRFVASLSWPWLRLDAYGEGRTWAERALRLPGEVDPRVRARALEAAGDLTSVMDDIERASELLGKSLVLFRQLGDTFWAAVVLDELAGLHSRAGRLPAARARYEESLALFSELSNEGGIAAEQHGLARTYLDLGETRVARPLLASEIRTHRNLGVPFAHAASLHSLDDLELEEGN